MTREPSLCPSDGIVTASKRAAPTLDSNVYSIQGNPTGVKELKQTIAVGGEEGDCYVFSGWAWADSAVPATEEKRAFDVTVKLHYNNTEHEEASRDKGTVLLSPKFLSFTPMMPTATLPGLQR